MRDPEQVAWGCIVFVVACLIFGFVYLKTNTYAVTGRVTAVTWQRDINVERFKALGQDTYQSQMPADAYNISRYTTQSCTTTWVSVRKAAIPITTCHTNYMARYTVNRWTYDRTLRASGSRHDERVWPDFTPSPVQELGADREASRQELFFVAFKAGDKTFTYSTGDLGVWQKYQIEADFTFSVNRLEEPQWDSLREKGN